MRRQKLDEQVHIVVHNVQHNNGQNNIEVSHDSNDSMYKHRNNMVADDGTTKEENREEQECDDNRMEGQPAVVNKVDDTDIGEV